MPVYVGTSGWQYRDWRGVLYPPGLAQGRWLDHYAGQFRTVENNSSFYRLPSRETFAGWRARTSSGFVMAVKASRYLTHVKRLRDPAQPVQRLMRAAAGLGDRLGPVLLQLPPNLPADGDALDACLTEFSRSGWPPAGEPPPEEPSRGEPAAGLPAGGRVRVAVEFRHPSWWTEDIRKLLTRHDAALCWADRLGQPVTPLWSTARWGYLRFHEGTARPWPRYGEQELCAWVQRIAATCTAGADVFVYFNNDPGGAALLDAAAFAALVRESGREVTPTWVPPEVAGQPGAAY